MTGKDLTDQSNETDVQKDIGFDDIKNNMVVFSSDDDRLKFLGEVFGNSTSRTIMSLLIEKDMAVMEIAKETGIKPNLVMHHLNKMMQAEIVTITKKTVNSRGHLMKHYKAKPAIMMFSKNHAKRAQKSKSLFRIIKRITRFASIGFAGTLTWMITSPEVNPAFKYPKTTLPPYMTPIETIGYSSDLVFAITVTLSVVIAGLVIERILSALRK